MEGLLYIGLLIGILFIIVFFTNKDQDKKDARKLLETVEWQRLNNPNKSSKHITKLSFDYLLAYMYTSRKGKVQILRLELNNSSLVAEETKAIVNRSIDIYFYLESKLGRPFDNYFEKDFYKEKVKAYQNFNDIDFWESPEEKDDYIRIWGILCEKGDIFNK